MNVVKIIVDGAFSSGKTSFIRAVSEREVVSVSVVMEADRPHKTIGMDFGEITDHENDVALVLLGTPGARRFSLTWQVAQHNMLGYIIMVDSANPVTWREAGSVLSTLRAYGFLPYVVAANKQDRFNAFSPDDIRSALNIPPEIPVLPCVATDKESVKRVLVALLDAVLRAVGVCGSGQGIRASVGMV
jgi:uncharacterized protein